MATKKSKSTAKAESANTDSITSITPVDKPQRLSTQQKSQIIKDWQDSGISLKAFSESSGHSYPNLMNWKKKFGKGVDKSPVKTSTTPEPKAVVGKPKKDVTTGTKSDLEAENQKLKIMLAEIVMKMHDSGKIDLLS